MANEKKVAALASELKDLLDHEFGENSITVTQNAPDGVDADDTAALELNTEYFLREIAEKFLSSDWLKDHDRKVVKKTAVKMRKLADARDAYSDPRVQMETNAVRVVAEIIDGTDEGWGWLPSWKWDEFNVPDPTGKK